MKMPSVLLACTHPLQATGYARVGCALANGLSRLGWRVVVYGFQNLAPVAERILEKNVTVLDVSKLTGNATGFGEETFPDVARAINPDVIILYNDVFVINSFLDHLVPTTKIVAYVDLVHDHQNPQLLKTIRDRVDSIWVFSEHWCVHEGDIVIPHGIDPAFSPLPVKQARVVLNLPLDGYIVLNSNRNSYRKALDVSIRIFLETYVHLKCPDDLYLFMNCTSCETGYDIPGVIDNECTRLGLNSEVIRNTRILGMTNAGFLSDSTLNVLYNACDIGLNTSVGEGFGLMALEMGSLGKPLIINATGGSRDVMGDQGVEPIETLELCRGFVAHGGRMDIPDSKEMIRRLISAYESRESSKDPPFDVEQYSWDTICSKASDALLKIYKK